MKTEKIQRRYGSGTRWAKLRLLEFFIVAVLVWVPEMAGAGTSQEKALFDTLYARCQDPFLPFPSKIFDLCTSVFTGGLAGGSFVPSGVTTNVGSTGVQGTASQSAAAQQRKCTGSPTECREVENKKKGGGASADFSFGNVGFLVSLQTGEMARKPTDLENGFDADFRGLTLGADYRFTDRFLVGLTLGYNDNDATFRESAGGLRSKTSSGTLYLTYTPLDNAYIGAYAGTGRIRNTGNKRVVIGSPVILISGTVGSSNRGTQDIAGVSGGYDWQVGGARVGAFLNVDSARNRVDGYTESGSTGMELIHPTQTIRSLTSTLGLRFSTSRALDWGTMQPEFRIAQVHEFRNDARVIQTALAIDPTTVFTVATDAPDRNYGLLGFGANLETGRGTRWFVDYERRVGHAFLSTWAANVGVIVGF